MEVTGFMIDKTLKVLIVDDFATMRRIIKNIFKQIGFDKFDEAEDGGQAYDKLKLGGFGLLVTDWNMPNVTGLELLMKVRSDPKLKDIPVLMVTAEAEKEQVIEAIKAGVNNYVTKPFTADTLKEKLEKIFDKLPKK
jgi:two-component system chemotaxis response regulator CheY